MATPITTIKEILRYRGESGQWRGMLHRICGFSTLLFFVTHVVNTSWVYFSPELYEETVRLHQTPLFTIAQFALVVCLVFHAFNGVRIVILDYKPSWRQYQVMASQIVYLATAVVVVPVLALMGQRAIEFYDGRPFDLHLGDVITQVVIPFGGGICGVLFLGVTVSFLFGAVTGKQETEEPRLSQHKRFEQFMWVFIRVSGPLLVVLVLGHLAIMHLIEGVFAINQSGVGQAANFVAGRWAFPGWRLYDAALLILALAHGFNGFRHMINDYAHDPIVRRGLHWATVGGGAVLVIIGATAIINGVPGS